MRDYYAGRETGWPSTVTGGPDKWVASAITTGGSILSSALDGDGGGNDEFVGDWGGNVGGGISPQAGLSGQHHSGPYSVSQVEAAIRSRGMNDSAVQALASHVWGSCEFDGRCGTPVSSSVKRDPKKLANATVFVAHGGVNGDLVRYERKARSLLDSVLNSATSTGAATPSSTPTATPDAPDDLGSFLDRTIGRWWETQKDLGEDAIRAGGATLAGGVEGQREGQRTGARAGAASFAGFSMPVLVGIGALLFFALRS